MLLGAAALASVARAQAGAGAVPEGLPLPPAVEKELAAKASDVTEVTLGKNMLEFAAKFMTDKEEDEAATRKLVEGLKGIYVREYDFDKEGEYSMEDVRNLRAYFETPEWSPMVHERERKKGETTDVLMKMVNGEPQGIFILETEPKELTIVMILGPIHMEDLSKLSGVAGIGGTLGPLSGVQHTPRGNDKPKDKAKDKKGDNE
jgi:hypothetical protein